MNGLRTIGCILMILAVVPGCQERKAVTTTTGSIAIECDEALFPVMNILIDDFQRTYPEATIIPTFVGARAAIVDFINDSTELIVSSRPFNEEELSALKTAEIEYREYKVALDAVAVILHKTNPLRKMRTSQLDSVLTGDILKWPPLDGKLLPIRIALCGQNSGTNEIVQTTIMDNKPFSPAVTYFDSSSQLLDFVRDNEGALGLIGISWLQDVREDVTIVSLGDPHSAPDSTQLPGTFYSPAQANIYRGYYPLSTEVYMYNRELLRTVGLGFISYANNVAGQRIFQANGLVPATMPIRLVETTSKQVTQ